MTSFVPDGAFDPQSSSLFPEIYEELRILATARMAGEMPGLTLQPTALVHEAWMKLTLRDDRKWNDREHFFRSAALAMRRILVESARRKRWRMQALQSNSEHQKEPAYRYENPEERLLRIDENLKKLEINDPESARVVLLKFFGGLTNREVAQSLGVSERTVERLWAYAKSTLLQMILSEDQTDMPTP
jgi:RNA polymerase sigma factor (TIGR02999 family)